MGVRIEKVAIEQKAGDFIVEATTVITHPACVRAAEFVLNAGGKFGFA
jgi:hypothetical protein